MATEKCSFDYKETVATVLFAHSSFRLNLCSEHRDNVLEVLGIKDAALPIIKHSAAKPTE